MLSPPAKIDFILEKIEIFMIHILTHRGIEYKNEYFSESTLEAFLDQLERGFGLEVDLNFTKDGIVFCHDADLKRMTRGKDSRNLKSLSTDEACSVKLPKGRFGTFTEVMQALKKHPNQMIALHLKGNFQQTDCCDIFIKHMQEFQDLAEQVLVFDLSIGAAKYIKSKMPQLQLAASVSHPYDIERFLTASKGTLLSLEQILKQLHYFTWAWLDEWDLMDRRQDGTINRRGKKLYTAEIFQCLRENGLKIALVTPELHGTSPGLLGGEAHPHASTKERLFTRIEEIISLRPDAVCTDYPEEVRDRVKQLET